MTQITEHRLTVDAHTTHYLSAGPEDGPLLIFVHGWPELSLSWRSQLPAFAELGFRVIAPDMRGYGQSTVYSTHADYAQRHVVEDMLRLIDSIGRETAVWIGHDWGSPTVWNIASHYPERCAGAANLCVPYYTLERGLDNCVGSIDRVLYPEATFPYGQWEYQCFYQENFARATAVMDANPYNLVKALFRKGNPKGVGKPAATAHVRQQNGWFNGAEQAPDIPHDADVVSLEELTVYADALQANGFFGPNSYYMNHSANEIYAEEARDGGVLEMPVLFIGARYDYTCETVHSTLAQPMRKYCKQLSEVTLDCGHWMAQEKPHEVNTHLSKWLEHQVSGHWPRI